MITQAWTIKDRKGRLLPRFVRCDRSEVERLVLPIHYDHARLMAEPDYRRQFDAHVRSVLEREGWTVVPITLAECALRAANGM